MQKRRKKIVIAKPGLDGHDRGAKVIARALRDKGYDVLYTGIRKAPEEIIRIVIDEDADCLGLSCLSGAHKELFKRVMDILKKERVKIPVFAGGIIPEEDIEYLKSIGINRVFGPGTKTDDIILYVDKLWKKA
ncbi:MAG: cobalamin B12-binding domain-containing protein [Candidatus Hydrogenedentota bacterium]